MLTDVLGRELRLDRPPRRVVSLVPSLTETLFDLGVGEAVVGVTDYCIFPEDLDRPRLGGTKNPHIDAIRALAPDLVLMNLEENLRRHAEQIETFAPLFVTEPKSVGDVAGLIVNLGRIFDGRERAAELLAQLERERSLMTRRHFTFAVAIWKKPWMWCGGDTYVSRLVEESGGTNILRDRERYPAIDVEEVRADVIFLPDEPYAFKEADVAECHVPTVIGPFSGHLFTWHGSRTILGLRWLREALAKG